MNRLASITFVEDLGLGQGVGYLTLETGEIEPKQYEVNYSAEKSLYERFSFYTERENVNLSKYLSEDDLERLNTLYYDFRTTNKSIAYTTVQLQNCYNLSIETLCS